MHTHTQLNMALARPFVSASVKGATEGSVLPGRAWNKTPMDVHLRCARDLEPTRKPWEGNGP